MFRLYRYNMEMYGNNVRTSEGYWWEDDEVMIVQDLVTCSNKPNMPWGEMEKGY